jgi:hypothetical protein
MTKKETSFMKTKRLSDIRTECSAETSLPDYNTDVRKILHVSAKPHPISSFASGEGIECSGEVAFDVVYLDFEGVVCSASFSGDYSFKVKCDTESYKDSLVETTLGNISLRLMSPRKIAARATLNSAVTIITEEIFTTEGDALEPDLNPQVNPILISSRSTYLTSPSEREYGCSFVRFEGKTTDEVHLIHLSTKPVVEHIEVIDGEAEISGRIEVTSLIRTDECPLYRLEKSLEMSEKIPLDKAYTDGECRAVVEVVSASVAINGDEGGVEMVLSVITETRVVSEKNANEELIADMYLCDRPCDCTRELFCYDEYFGLFSSEKEINNKISFSNIGVGKLREVIFADVNVVVDSVETLENEAVIKGEVKVSAIATEMNDDGAIEFIPLKFSVEFKENVNCDCHIDGKTTVFVDAYLSGESVMVDSDNVYLKANMILKASLSKRHEAEVLSQAKVSSAGLYTKNPARISVYYPEEGDTLYMVAKAYHTTKEKLLSDNSTLVETVAKNGDISSVKRLIIT